MGEPIATTLTAAVAATASAAAAAPPTGTAAAAGAGAGAGASGHAGGWAFGAITGAMGMSGGAFAYVIVFFLLFFAGWLVPLPEEATVIAAGYVTKRYALHMPLMTACVLGGIQCGDLVIFWIGRRHGDWVFSSRIFRRILPEERLTRARKLFAEHGSKMSFFGRFIMGVRLVVFFTAGNLGVPISTFIFYDFLAILVTIPIGLYGGWYFADRIDDAFKLAARSNTFIFRVVIVGLVAWFIWTKVHERIEARIEGKKRAQEGTDAPG